MRQITFRLKPGQLLKEEIERMSVEHAIQAGVLLSLVGSLQRVVLRMAGATVDAQTVKEWNESFEIVSGTGTISKEGCHIHMSVSNQHGNVIGGHLKDGCVVQTTVEVVIGIFEDVSYQRILDNETGFRELVVEKITSI